MVLLSGLPGEDPMTVGAMLTVQTSSKSPEGEEEEPPAVRAADLISSGVKPKTDRSKPLLRVEVTVQEAETW